MPTAQARETHSLTVTRAWLVLSMCVLSWTLTAGLTLTRPEQISPAERLCILAAGALIGAALVLARVRGTLWLTVIAMLLLAATAIVPSGSLVWTYPQTYLGYVGFICSMLLPKRVGLVTAWCVPLIVWLIWQTDPANVVPEAFTVADGWVLVLRMLGAQILLWWSWWWLRGLATRVDTQIDELRSSQVSAAAREERAYLWRTSADRVHATLLNSIAALLEVRSVDAPLLRRLAQEGRDAIGQPPSLVTSAPSGARLTPVNAGVVLITAALGGALFAGWLYTAFVPFSSAWQGLLAVTLAVASASAAIVIVLRHRAHRWWVGCLLVLAPGALPWVLTLAPTTCDAIGPVAAAASMAGFAIVCIGLWTRWVSLALGLLIWVPGALAIGRATPVECSIAPTVIVLNVATFLPLVAIIALVGISRHRRAIGRLQQAEIAADVAEARAATLEALDGEMSQSVRRTADELDAIADRGAMDTDDVVRLQCLAARMRAAVHVDVGAAHGFVRDAYDLVIALADQGIPVTTGLLTGTEDDRPLPREVVALLTRAAQAAPVGPLRLQTVDAGAFDFLSLACPIDACRAAGLPLSEERRFGYVVVSAHQADAEPSGQAMAIITAERTALVGSSTG